MFEGRFKISMHVRTSASQDEPPVARWNSMCIFKALQFIMFIVSGEIEHVCNSTINITWYHFPRFPARPIIDPKWYVISPSLLLIPRCSFQIFSTWVPPRYAKTSVLTNQLIRGPAFELEVWWITRLGHRSSYVVSVKEKLPEKIRTSQVIHNYSRKCISSWSCLRAFFCLASPHRSRTRGTLCLWQMLWHGFEPLS